MPKKQLSILVDQCIHSAIVELLERLGYIVETAGSAGLATAADEAIFRYAQVTKQVLLTFDADFGNILRFDPKKSHGIVVVYVYNIDKQIVLSMIQNFFSHYSKRLNGNLYIVEHNQVRVWPKPRPRLK